MFRELFVNIRKSPVWSSSLMSLSTHRTVSVIPNSSLLKRLSYFLTLSDKGSCTVSVVLCKNCHFQTPHVNAWVTLKKFHWPRLYVCKPARGEYASPSCCFYATALGAVIYSRVKSQPPVSEASFPSHERPRPLLNHNTLIWATYAASFRNWLVSLAGGGCVLVLTCVFSTQLPLRHLSRPCILKLIRPPRPVRLCV